MNHKILSFLLSFIFLFEVPAMAYSKHINTAENNDIKASQALKKNTISNTTLSKIKNNIGSIIYKSIAAGIVLIDLYLIYDLFFKNNSNQQQNISDRNVDHNIGQPQQPQKPISPAYGEAFAMTDDIIENIDYVPINGIRNIGNTCYMNAAIQQLYKNNKFRNHILKQRSIIKVNCPFTWSLYHIFNSIRNNNPLEDNELRELVKLLGHHEFQQQDSEEYMRQIIKKCSRELNQIEDIINISNVADASNSQNGDSLVDLIKMSAPLDADKIREDILKKHPDWKENSKDFIKEQDQILEQSNPNYHTIPDIKTNDGTEIIIPINRTFNNGFDTQGIAIEAKNNSQISIPLKINLERDFNIQDDNRVYTLSCVTVHLGDSGASGHYIVYEKSAERKWYEISDNSVKEIQYSDIKPIIEKNATILTYTLSDVNEQEPQSNINTVKDNPGRLEKIKRFFRAK